MSTEGLEAVQFEDSHSFPTLHSGEAPGPPSVALYRRSGSATANAQAPTGPRRTPRKSLIVVLPENHVVSPDLVTDHLATAEGEDVDVILACAGQPLSIAALQRKIGGLQVLLAPAGTGTEDLRELAMNQAPGDVVTLLSGTPV